MIMIHCHMILTHHHKMIFYHMIKVIAHSAYLMDASIREHSDLWYWLSSHCGGYHHKTSILFTTNQIACEIHKMEKRLTLASHSIKEAKVSNSNRRQKLSLSPPSAQYEVKFSLTHTCTGRVFSWRDFGSGLILVGGDERHEEKFGTKS